MSKTRSPGRAGRGISKRLYREGRMSPVKLEAEYRRRYSPDGDCMRCGERSRLDPKTNLCGHCTADAAIAEELR